MTNDWTVLDSQLRAFAPFVRDELRIVTPESECVASSVARELRELAPADLVALVANDVVPARDRLDELKAFQTWMDVAHDASWHPGVVRAQVVTQNYLCFVYLGDALFKALQKAMPAGSISKKCAKFLTDDRVRAFRNAVAHANWHYMPDFGGLEFWARKGSDPTAPMTRFEVRQKELGFWQMLARAVAYVTYTEITKHNQ